GHIEQVFPSWAAGLVSATRGRYNSGGPRAGGAWPPRETADLLMTPPTRTPHIHHCTSEPYPFFRRAPPPAMPARALPGEDPSVRAMVGPGGQGKTAIVQHWLQGLAAGPRRADGVFLWSFYRGKDADLCLRELYAYAEGLPAAPDLSASYCVDHLL